MATASSQQRAMQIKGWTAVTGNSNDINYIDYKTVSATEDFGSLGSSKGGISGYGT